jgi:hypothetical protein
MTIEVSSLLFLAVIICKLGLIYVRLGEKLNRPIQAQIKKL